MSDESLRILVAPDSFKGSLSAARVAEVVDAAAQTAIPGCTVDLLPMADGGEGTIDVVARALGGTRRKVHVHDPLLRPIDASYLVIASPDADNPDDKPEHATALIETAAASGLTLLRRDERDPRATSSYGTGELIADALRQGYGRIIVALGGSATVDGGAGALAALGMRFIDGTAKPFVPTGGTLSDIEDMDPSNLMKPKRGCRITVLCDVDNPLLGTEGAAYTFGPQKFGSAHDATHEALAKLEEGMRHYVALAGALTAMKHDIDPYAEPGAGAAGGLGYALTLFLGAKMEPGVEVIAELVGLGEHLTEADVVVTGEGRLDAQTAHGKVVWGVAQAAGRAGVPCYVVAGSAESGLLADFGTMPGSFAELADEDAPSLFDALDSEDPQASLFSFDEPGEQAPSLFDGLDESDDSSFGLFNEGGRVDRPRGNASGLIVGMEVASDRTMDVDYAMAHAEPLLESAAKRLFEKMSADF